MTALYVVEAHCACLLLREAALPNTYVQADGIGSGVICCLLNKNIKKSLLAMLLGIDRQIAKTVSSVC